MNQEISLGIGYLHTFISQPDLMILIMKNGLTQKGNILGQGHLMKTGAIGLGGNRGADLSSDFWMIKPTMMHLKPFGTDKTLNFALDAGFQLRQ